MCSLARRRAGLSLCLLLMLAVPQLLPGQSTAARIWDVVTDPSGATIPSAAVVATNTETGWKVTANSNGEGRRGESQFRTWLYRIAANHLLNVKKQKRVASEALCSFADAAVGLGRVPDFDPPDPRTVPVPVEVLVSEAGIGCMIGTLLCLDGRQRLVFVLGEVFGVSDEVGGELVEVTPANFRQILSRARADLYEYLRGNCSLVDPGNTCKCARKTRAFIQGRFVDPEKLRFTADYCRQVREVASERAEEWSDAYMKLAASVYRDHSFYEPAEQVEILRKELPSIPLDPTA